MRRSTPQRLDIPAAVCFTVNGCWQLMLPALKGFGDKSGINDPKKRKALVIMKYSVTRRCGGFIAIILVLGFMPHGDTVAQQDALTPTETVQQAFSAADRNRPEMIFDLLPASYQNDIENIVVAIAQNADVETWNQARNLIAKFSRVLMRQQDLLTTVLIKHIPATDDPRSLKDGIKALSAMTGHLAASGISDLERLQQGNLRQLLATDGHALMAALEKVAGAAPDTGDRTDLWASARTATVELLNADENTATVRTIVGDETEDIDLVRIDGRWIPAEMADGWQESMSEMRRNIAAMDMSTPKGQQQKQMAAMMLGMADGILSQIEQAKTVEDIDRIVAGMMALMMGGGNMQH